MRPEGEARLDLSVVIPALNEAENLAGLLPLVRQRLDGLGIAYEIVVVDELADEATRRVAGENGARLLSPPGRGYGNALRAGFEQARGAYLITMDADLSHPPDFLAELWAARRQGEVVIASRYVAGGRAQMPLGRLALSWVLNLVFSRGLDLPVRDMSSGYRLYRTRALRRCQTVNRDFDVLQELLVKMAVEGYRICERPFHYRPRRHGSSHARVLRFGLAYLRAFGRLWRLRHSAESADDEWRAYDSLLPWRRRRQRRLYRLAAGLLQGEGGRCLAVGGAASRLMRLLPRGSVALDGFGRYLRYLGDRFGGDLRGVEGRLPRLGFAGETFGCVLCLQVSELLPPGAAEELDRLLRPGGRLVLRLAGGRAAAGEGELVGDLTGRLGYALEEKRGVGGGEWLLALRKPATTLFSSSSLHRTP